MIPHGGITPSSHVAYRSSNDSTITAFVRSIFIYLRAASQIHFPLIVRASSGASAGNEICSPELSLARKALTRSLALAVVRIMLVAKNTNQSLMNAGARTSHLTSKLMPEAFYTSFDAYGESPNLLLIGLICVR
jgi:hypothetical protein